jgi:hypothetical protein
MFVWMGVQDLTYTVQSKGNKKEKVSLLKGLTGCMCPGMMTALVSEDVQHVI